MRKLSKSILLIIWLAAYLVISIVPAYAQTSTDSGTSTGSATLPQTGIETPILIITGAGLALFASGFLFKKLQTYN